MTLAYVSAAFFVGAYVALVVRAMVGRHADRRIERATQDALEPEHLDRLRAYLREIDQQAQRRHELKKLGVHLP